MKVPQPRFVSVSNSRYEKPKKMVFFNSNLSTAQKVELHATGKVLQRQPKASVQIVKQRQDERIHVPLRRNFVLADFLGNSVKDKFMVE